MKELNPYILVAMDWKNKTQEELKNNDDAAAAAAADATDAAAATDAAVAAAADATDAAVAEYWITKYFDRTGDNREDYEAALNKQTAIKPKE